MVWTPRYAGQFISTAIFVSCGLLAVAHPASRAAAQTPEFDSVKLFDATSSFDTGPVTSPPQFTPFASTSLTIDFAPGDIALLSSTPDGTRPVVIDNFITINRRNVCSDVAGQLFRGNCFGPFVQPDVTIGLPIDTFLTPIPPIDVSSFIRVGETVVRFELFDFGVIAGNTELFLVTTATVTPIQPVTIDNAFDAAMELVTGQLRPIIVEEFQHAFEQQVARPLLSDLRRSGADAQTIARLEQQLVVAGAEKASVAADTVTTALDGQELLTELSRQSNTGFAETTIPPRL